MTTPTGTISMTDIQTEFGGSNPIGLTEYYAGGAYVPSGISGVPSSGTISMNNLRGKTKVTPYTVTVYPNATTEGNWFTAIISSSNPVYGTVYWKITDYVAMTSSPFNSADFESTSGQSYLDYEYSGGYTAVSIRGVTDAAFDTGKFKVSVYADPSYTTLLGTSQEVLLADSYSASTPTVSRTSIYRYSNLNTAYTASLISMNTSGLEGAALYYEVYTTTPGATLTSADIDSPATLTGSQLVPAGGTVQLVFRATAWNGASYIPNDKNIVVRWRLGDANGAIIGTSPAVLLYKTPTFAASISPTIIREGYTTTLTVTMLNIPIDPTTPAASVYYTTTGTASLIDDFLGSASFTGSISFGSNTLQLPLTAKIDIFAVSESDETLYITFRLNSTSGTPFWVIGDNPPSNPPLIIESPAMVIDATATATTVQINNVSPYPEARTFDILFRAKPAASAGAVTGYGSWNTTSSGSSLVAGAYSMTAPAVVYNTNPNSNNGVFDFEIKLSSLGYADYTITRTSSVQTWPIYGFDFTVTGANSNGSTRTIYAQITSTPTYPEQRNFVIEYRIKSANAPENTWTAWTTGFSSTVNVGINSTFSAFTQIRPPTVAQSQFDVQLRCVLPWNYIRETPIQYGLWL